MVLAWSLLRAISTVRTASAARASFRRRTTECSPVRSARIPVLHPQLSGLFGVKTDASGTQRA